MLIPKFYEIVSDVVWTHRMEIQFAVSEGERLSEPCTPVSHLSEY